MELPAKRAADFEGRPGMSKRYRPKIKNGQIEMRDKWGRVVWSQSLEEVKRYLQQRGDVAEKLRENSEWRNGKKGKAEI
jgi:hypothetical protein